MSVWDMLGGGVDATCWVSGWDMLVGSGLDMLGEWVGHVGGMDVTCWWRWVGHGVREGA